MDRRNMSLINYQICETLILFEKTVFNRTVDGKRTSPERN